MSESDNPLEDLLEDAEEEAEEYSETRRRLTDLKDRLREQIQQLVDENVIDHGTAGRLDEMIDRGRYGKVRDTIADVLSEDGLEFESDDLNDFARAFEDSFEDLEIAIEEIRTSLLALERGGPDREDLIDLLYGKHNHLTKGQLNATFDAIDDVATSSVDVDVLARVLAAFEPDLNITGAREVLRAVEAEVDDG